MNLRAYVVRRHEPAHASRVSEIYERQVFALKNEIWSESISSGAVPNSHFYNINSYTWYLFKTHKSLTGKH